MSGDESGDKSGDEDAGSIDSGADASEDEEGAVRACAAVKILRMQLAHMFLVQAVYPFSAERSI